MNRFKTRPLFNSSTLYIRIRLDAFFSGAPFPEIDLITHAYSYTYSSLYLFISHSILSGKCTYNHWTLHFHHIKLVFYLNYFTTKFCSKFTAGITTFSYELPLYITNLHAWQQVFAYLHHNPDDHYLLSF